MTTETISEAIIEMAKQSEINGKTIYAHLKDGNLQYLNGILAVIQEQTIKREHGGGGSPGAKKWMNFTLSDNSFLKVVSSKEDAEEKQEAKNANTIFFNPR